MQLIVFVLIWWGIAYACEKAAEEWKHTRDKHASQISAANPGWHDRKVRRHARLRALGWWGTELRHGLPSIRSAWAEDREHVRWLREHEKLASETRRDTWQAALTALRGQRRAHAQAVASGETTSTFPAWLAEQEQLAEQQRKAAAAAARQQQQSRTRQPRTAPGPAPSGGQPAGPRPAPAPSTGSTGPAGPQPASTPAPAPAVPDGSGGQQPAPAGRQSPPPPAAPQGPGVPGQPGTPPAPDPAAAGGDADAPRLRLVPDQPGNGAGPAPHNTAENNGGSDVTGSFEAHDIETARQVATAQAQELQASASSQEQYVNDLLAGGMGNDTTTMQAVATAQEATAQAAAAWAQVVSGLNQHSQGEEYANTGIAAKTEFLKNS
jgi:hypothetical protein